MIRVRTVALTAVDAAVLVALRPDPGALRDGLAAPHAWIDRVGADRALAALAAAGLWLVALWLGVGLLAAVLSVLPGRAGRCAARFTRIALPAALRRVIAGTAGLGVLLAPVAGGLPSAGAAPSNPQARATLTQVSGQDGGATAPAQDAQAQVARSAQAQVAAAAGAQPRAVALPPPAWPTDPPKNQPTGTPTTTPRTTPTTTTPTHLPAPTWPTTPRETSPRSTSPREPQPAAPTTSDGAVLVHTGDSLWLLAARRLGPQASDRRIAQEWPRWYAANRAVIGNDPDRLVPGQVLHAPDDRQEGP